MTIDGKRLAEGLAVRLKDYGNEIAVFWWVPNGGRDEAAIEIVQGRGSAPLVPFIVRDSSFTNANAIQNDVAKVLEELRSEIQEIQSKTEPDGPLLGIVLLLREPLSTPACSSPLNLPDWLPRAPGRAVTVVLEPASSGSIAGLGAPESRITALREATWDLDSSLSRSLRSRLALHESLIDSLFSLVKSSVSNVGAANKSEWVNKSISYLDSVTDVSAYRMGMSRPNTVLAGTLGCFVRLPGDSRERMAKALSQAVGLHEIDSNVISFPDLSMVGLIQRPTSAITTQDRSFAFDILVATLTAHQLSTAAAHADSYPAYPIEYISLISEDVLRIIHSAPRFLHLTARDNS
jgi:hypothetical protein